MPSEQFGFERLLHPIGEDTFLREYWERKPLVIARDDPRHYADILSTLDVESIVGFRQLQHSQLKVARVERGALPHEVFYVDGESASDTNRLFHSYVQGDTVVLNHAQCYWEPAARLCSALERFFHFPAGANVYVTPREAQGFPPHFDSHDVFVLQLEGSKHWRIYDSAAQLPCGTENEQPISPHLLGEPQLQFRLNAGDLLYIPRGYVHEASTADVASVHVTIGLRAYTWTNLVSELLAALSEEDVEFRRALPAGFSDSQEAFRLIADRLPELIRTLGNPSRVEHGIGRLRERLIERMRPLPDGHFRSLDKVDQVDLNTLVAKRPGMLCFVSRKAESVELTFPGNRMQGPADVETAFRFIANSQDGFPVRALPDTLSDNSKLIVAKRAIREGLLTVLS